VSSSGDRQQQEVKLWAELFHLPHNVLEILNKSGQVGMAIVQMAADA
jgi:hypothetical protein